MKKAYKIISILTVMLLLTVNGVAQLSGVWTINKTLPTAGTNFNSFNDCATVLNSLGVSGPVTVNVVAGTGTYSEQVTFNQAPGISAIQNVVINGNGNTIAFSPTS